MQDNRIDRPSQAPRWWQVARHGRCPACGAPGMVWAGRVWEPPKLADHCRACGQPFAEHEASGRALYPVVIPLVALLVFSALRVDDIWRLPLWVYPLVWGPASALLVGLAVRATRAAVLAARVPARMQGQEQGGKQP
ncbi:DUF983 domain-containing protein [Novosphingobium pokkalii]|uniref:DUF983 domain-containing protein n=1 Tax=Novosphingobium pokkalii TaxID=1770194 RepID=A0ABV7UZJ6_9SPHN|nr:DUF983 domain-containing protein [Novosphingobium pokkalii]GHC96141.1 hypothetical protein GCM10019060_25860 [Novosphingobium pokkalii]